MSKHLVEIKRLISQLRVLHSQGDLSNDDFQKTLDLIDEFEEDEIPENSYSETIYHVGKKPHWQVGDTLAFYEYYDTREGEYLLGKVVKVEFGEEGDDWYYTFEDGDVWNEETLLREETYKK